MNTHDIIRAWKDPGFRARLTQEQRSKFPESPAGLPMTELEEPALTGAVGGQPGDSGVLGIRPTSFCAPPTFAGDCDGF
jgi:mersacidin/lichenicidin family type 2 lantibiotic